VVPASASGETGFSGEDLVWLLQKAPTEVLVLRPGPQDRRVVSVNGAGIKANGR
jgi:hypothetical protein